MNKHCAALTACRAISYTTQVNVVLKCFYKNKWRHFLCSAQILIIKNPFPKEIPRWFGYKTSSFGHFINNYRTRADAEISKALFRQEGKIWCIRTYSIWLIFWNHSHIQFEIQSDFLQICPSERSGCISSNSFVINDLNFVSLSTVGFYDLYVTLYKRLNIVWSCVWTPSHSLTLFSHSKRTHWREQCLCYVLSCASWVHKCAEPNFHLSILTGICSQLSYE